MSTLACLCGHIIREVVSPSKTEGALVGDVEDERAAHVLEVLIESFLEAVRSQARNAWIRKHFSVEYPLDLRDSEVISDLITSLEREDRRVSECERCGRLWVQAKAGENRYVSYRPDEEKYHGVLS